MSPDLPGEAWGLIGRCGLRRSGKARPALKAPVSHTSIQLVLFIFRFGNACLVACICHSSHECFRTLGGRYFARKDSAELHILAVDGFRWIVILLHHRAFECYAGE